MKCFATSENTHMPFVVEHNGKQLLLFSWSPCSYHTTWNGMAMQYQPWQLAWSDWLDESDGIHPIPTGLPPESINCNAVGTSLGPTLYLSFVSRPESTGAYRMFAMQGNSITSLSAPIEIAPPPLWSGFDTGSLKCVVPTQRDRLILNGHDVFIPSSNLDDIIRAVPAGSDILVTGRKGSVFKTFAVSPEGEVHGEIRYQGQSIYKSGLWGNDVVFAQQQKLLSFEERELHWGQYEIV